jgi:NADH-quinone oxidoreductase subunit A
MLTQGYGLLFTLFVFSLAFGLQLLAIAWIVSPKAPNPLKQSPYESGMPLFGPAHIQFDAKFYLFSLLFLLFDIESIFLFPWAVAFNVLGWFGIIEMAIFVGILALGLIYAWRRKALDWQ